MTSIYSVILSILKRALVMSLGAAGLALIAYSIYSLKKTEAQAIRFVTNHVAALAEAGVNSQNVNEIDKEIARFTQTWKETQDLDLRVDISLDGKLISHAGQLQPFGMFHSRVEETLALASGQPLRIKVEIGLASFIQSGIELLASIGLFIGLVFLVLMWLMKRMTIISVAEPLETRIEWLRKIAENLPTSAHSDESPVGRSKILEIEELTSSISTLLRQIVLLEKNLAAVVMDRLRVSLAEEVAHSIKGVIATLQLKINTLPNLSLKDHRDLNDCISSLRDVSGSLLNSDSLKGAETEASAKTEPIHILSSLKTIIASKQTQYSDRSVVVELHNEVIFFGAFCALSAGEMQTIFASLLDNAIEAIQSSGRVSISGASRENALEIRISDSGAGIPGDVLDRLFKGRVTYGKKNGNGIGLAHSKQIIEKIDGSIAIQSEVGSGTTVSLVIPLAQKMDLFLERVEIPAHGKMVIVDDDLLVHSIWKHRFAELSAPPAEVTYLSSPKDFEAWIEENGHGNFGSRLYLFDCDLKDECASGLDLVEKFGLAFESVLISGMAENAEVLSRSRRLGLRWLPKDFLGIVPVVLGGLPEKASFLGVV